MPSALTYAELSNPKHTSLLLPSFRSQHICPLLWRNGAFLPATMWVSTVLSSVIASSLSCKVITTAVTVYLFCVYVLICGYLLSCELPKGPALLSMNVTWMVLTQAIKSCFTNEQMNQMWSILAPCPQRLIQDWNPNEISDNRKEKKQIPGKDFWVPESDYNCVCHLWKFRDTK